MDSSELLLQYQTIKMAENYEFDQNQDQDDHIDTNFHPEQQEEFEAYPKEEENPP